MLYVYVLVYVYTHFTVKIKSSVLFCSVLYFIHYFATKISITFLAIQATGSYHAGQVEDKTSNAGVFVCMWLGWDGQEKLVKNNWIIYEKFMEILQRCVVP